ncbi:MAG TPA: HEAT repeat domain-containing protein [Vicinamibacteria bacterium]|nr:HEAT repeat domain-containing protein [Vicinamibacteria bacterium]
MIEALRLPLVFSLGLGLVAPALAASKASYDDLVANLKSPNARTRQEAAAALGKSRRREAVAHLAPLVRDPELKVRMEVVRSFRELRDLAAVPSLVTSLGDGDAALRREAVGTLVEIYAEKQARNPLEPLIRLLKLRSDEADRSTVTPFAAVDPAVHQGLARVLRDEDKEVRQGAALALGILGGSSALRELATALQDPVPEVRAAAATAMGKVGTTQDGRSLMPLLADESPEVRERALHALGVLRVKEAGPELATLYESSRKKPLGTKVLSTLSRIGDTAQGDLFVQVMQESDPERKRLAVEGLGRISDAARLAALKKDYQRERDEEVRLAYCFALALMGDRAFLDTIVLALPSRTLGDRARGYLLEMGRGVLPDLYPYLGDQDAEIRAGLSDIIGAIGDPEAIPRLTPLLSDPSARVADHANRAVERLRRASQTAAAQ